MGVKEDYASNYNLFDALSEEMERKYLIANHVELCKYPSNIRAFVFATEPSSTSFSCEYYPVAAKINIKGKESLYFVINLYDYDKTVHKDKSEYFRFDCLEKPLIFDENRNIHTWKKGLFGFKLV